MKIAIAQVPPLFLNKAACIDKIVEIVKEASGNGASLLVFPEAFIGGYPVWIWRLRPGSDSAPCAELYNKLVEQACNLRNDDLAPVLNAAKKYNITLICGLNERDACGSQSTLYNTAVVINNEGVLINKHRKLMPTNAERMIWGQGNGNSLSAIQTTAGKLGTLICWENYMPLARYALYAQGIEIYVAPTYDSGDVWISSMQHIARESGCWVISANNAFQARDLSEPILALTGAYPEPTEWVNPGDSLVVAPNGKIIAGPWNCERGVFYADIDVAQVTQARRSLDVAGHYARPDIFHLAITPTPESPVSIKSAGK